MNASVLVLHALAVRGGEGKGKGKRKTNFFSYAAYA